MNDKGRVCEAPPAADLTGLRSAAARILGSTSFARCASQRRFLQFIVEETLAGRADRLKGYTLGIEVFGRDRSFDPVSDPIVRVEAGRLRARLCEYYDAEGAADPIRIEVPKGSYAVTVRGGEGARKDNSARLPAIAHLAEKPSIAVLPFADEGGDSGQQYFADGVTDDVITDLSRISGLFVLCRQSSFAYRDAEKQPAAIAEELGVRYLATGRVRRFGDRVRISAELVDGASSQTVWAERYDRSRDEIFAMQDEVVGAIVRALKVKLTPTESDRLGHEGTANGAAHDALMRGLEQFWRYSQAGCFAAEAYFRRALDLDPAYAGAHAWLARCICLQWSHSWTPVRERTLDPAFVHAGRAVALDDASAFCHSMLGWVHLWRREGEQAVAETRLGCALDPNSADAHLFAAMSLAATGQGQEALAYIEAAMRLNPQPSALYFFALGKSLCALGDFEQAAAALKRGLALNAAFLPNHYYLAVVYALSGRQREARETAARLTAIWPERDRGESLMWIDPRLAAVFLDAERQLGLAP
jgi:TolB-like protein/tetratricopeptide (TPR) repeat protein